MRSAVLLSLPDDARCALHPEARAVAVCDRCGAFACEGCAVRGEGWQRCARCGAPSVRQRVPGQLTFAVVLSAMGVVCAPLSLLAVALALGWKWGRWKDRTPLERDYVRWTVWVGLMGFVFSALIAAFTLIMWTTLP